MKNRIYIILIGLILLISFGLLEYKYMFKEDIEEPIKTIYCTLNNRVYTFDIYFDNEKLVYKTNTSEDLMTPFIYKSEEEISNVITSVYENKGAVCEVNSNLDIKIEL